jgi:hypothetical protein
VTDEAMGGFLHNMLAPPDTRDAHAGPPYTHTFQPGSAPGPGAVGWLRAQIKADKVLAERTLARWPGRSRWLERLADCAAKLALLEWCEDADQYVVADILPMVASAYRYRDGYGQFWGPPVTHTITEAASDRRRPR